jgi:outer membrane protein assembly factor BamB
MIVEGKCIAFVGGNSGALTSFDLVTGEPKWQCIGAGEPYGSPVLMAVEGTRQIVTPTMTSIAGIGLDGGKLLWQVKFSANNYQNSLGTPIVDAKSVIYFSPGKPGY